MSEKLEPRYEIFVGYVKHLREVLELVNQQTPCAARSWTLEEYETMIESGEVKP